MFPSVSPAKSALAPRRARPLLRCLRRGVLSLVTAATVAAATALPAHADRRSDDFAKALAAIAAIALIANQLDDRNDRDDRYNPPYRPPVSHPYRPPVVTHPRPQPEPARRPRVPAVCAIEIEDDYDVSNVYGERCLRREGFDYRLPQRCAREVRLQGRNDRIYTERCLREAGFKIGRREYY